LEGIGQNDVKELPYPFLPSLLVGADSNGTLDGLAGSISTPIITSMQQCVLDLANQNAILVSRLLILQGTLGLGCDAIRYIHGTGLGRAVGITDLPNETRKMMLDSNAPMAKACSSPSQAGDFL
jgi:hypothetical protein